MVSELLTSVEPLRAAVQEFYQAACPMVTSLVNTLILDGGGPESWIQKIRWGRVMGGVVGAVIVFAAEGKRLKDRQEEGTYLEAVIAAGAGYTAGNMVVMLGEAISEAVANGQ